MSDEGTKMSALFGEIQNKGDGITQGLSHVTDDQKVYKQERESKSYNFDDLYAKKAAAEERRLEKEGEKSQHQHVGEPEFGLKLNRFIVKNIVGGPDEKQERKNIDEIALNHGIVMTSCKYTVLQVKGKFNSLTMMQCKHVAVGCENIVSSIDISNCVGVTLYISGVVRCVVLDKCSEVNLVFSNPETARTVQVVTSVCSAVNVRFPNKEDEDEMLERPLPEQYVSSLKPDGKGFFKVVTKPADI